LAARGLTVGNGPDPRALRTPRDTFKVFLAGMQERSSANSTAFRALDTSELSDVVRHRETPLLARYLQEVMGRIGYPVWQEIPDDPESRRPYTHFQHPEGDIVVGPVEKEDGAVIWQFTPDTLRNIRSIYAAMDDMPLPPNWSGSTSTLDIYFATRDLVRRTMPSLLLPAGPLEGWQWVALGFAGLFGLGLGFAGSRGALSLSNRLSWTNANSPGEAFLLGWAVRLLVFGVVFLVATHSLGLADSLATLFTTVGWVLIVASLVPLIWHAIGVVAEGYRQRDYVMGATLTLVSLASGVARVVMVVGAILLLAHVLSLPYQGVIAGLGIGGLAVALAAQPTLQNLLSGFTLYADKPLAVGDFCRFGDKTGTIEHIGIRSTRIRSLDRTIITVPNSEFANMQLENFALRDRILLSTVLQLRYETTPDQLRFVLAELRKLLIAHPKIAGEPLRVRFTGFGAHSLDIEIHAYVLTPDINEFHAVREDLLLRMMHLIEEAGTQFAFPSTVHYHAEDKPLDQRRVDAAEQQVAAWRAEEQLPFPDYDWPDKAEFSNTLDYPPVGSVLSDYDRDPLFPREPRPARETGNGKELGNGRQKP
jgi:MscS family membrane protein